MNNVFHSIPFIMNGVHMKLSEFKDSDPFLFIHLLILWRRFTNWYNSIFKIMLSIIDIAYECSYSLITPTIINVLSASSKLSICINLIVLFNYLILHNCTIIFQANYGLLKRFISYNMVLIDNIKMYHYNTFYEYFIIHFIIEIQCQKNYVMNNFKNI